MDIHFLAIAQPFLVNRAEIFYGNSGDGYLSISNKTSWLLALFSFFDFWGASDSNQKVDPHGGPFG